MGKILILVTVFGLFGAVASAKSASPLSIVQQCLKPAFDQKVYDASLQAGRSIEQAVNDAQSVTKFNLTKYSQALQQGYSAEDAKKLADEQAFSDNSDQCLRLRQTLSSTSIEI